MTPQGWFVLALSVGTVSALFFWCIWKVIRTPEAADRLHGFEREPPDVSSEDPEDEDPAEQ